MAAIQPTDDEQVRLSFASTDAEGVSSVPENLTVTIDHPELASLEVPADPRNGDYIVRRVPGGNGEVTVVVTGTSPSPVNLAPDLVTTVTITFTPGATTSLIVTPTAEPITTGA